VARQKRLEPATLCEPKRRDDRTRPCELVDSQIMNEGSEARRKALIVVPAYNEERNIVSVLTELSPFRRGFDILVVNDGSSDGTEGLVNATGILQAVLPCNLGYSRAVRTGLLYGIRGGYSFIVLFDADGQHHASDIPALIAPVESGQCDLTLGSRYLSGQSARAEPLGRRIGQWVFSRLASTLAGRTLSDTTCGFKAMTSRVAEELLKTQSVDMHSEILVYLIRLGYRVGEVPIRIRTRTHGRSMYSLMSHVTYPVQTGLMVCIGWLAASLRKAGSD
jgi:glycosyltransferase involved in cell wall biosynthesis